MARTGNLMAMKIGQGNLVPSEVKKSKNEKIEDAEIAIERNEYDLWS